MNSNKEKAFYKIVMKILLILFTNAVHTEGEQGSLQM